MTDETEDRPDGTPPADGQDAHPFAAEDAGGEPRGDAGDGGEAEGDEGGPETGRRRSRPNRTQRLQARLERLEAENRAFRERLAPPEADPEPRADEYPDFDAYQRSLARWEGRQEDRMRGAAREAAEAETRRAEAMLGFRARADAVRDGMADFDRLVFDQDLPVTPAMAEAILESEKGPALAYHLATNPDLAERLAGLGPVQAARELGRIESELSLPRPKRVSGAPDPVRSVVGGTGAPTRDPTAMSMSEYRRARESGALR